MKLTNEVENHLKELDAHKSQGPDMISPRILKECTQQLSTLLHTLFNKSFTTGLIPQEWKMANITPIHKKGPKKDIKKRIIVKLV